MEPQEKKASMIWLARIFWLLSIVFAVTGGIFLLFPNQLIRIFNEISHSLSSSFEDLPLFSSHLWNLFSFAYMVLVTALAILIARFPKEACAYLWLLFLGKISTALIGLFLFFWEKHALLYLATFFADGAIAAICLGAIYLLKRTVPNETEG